jgi:predicted nucleic acid-binding protein
VASTLVDTNIWVDLFNLRSEWRPWCDRQIEIAKRSGPVVINPIIYAELAAGFPSENALSETFGPDIAVREDLPWGAAFLAGKAHLSYRRGGGEKRSPMPDFYIGAHAAVMGHRLLTRDAGRYRTYFPLLQIISPETHP